MTVYRIAHQALGLAVVRLALGLAGFLAALAAGAERGSAAVGLAFGTGASAIALISDRRFVLFSQPTLDPLPADAAGGGLSGAIGRGLLPSTVGVTALLAIALAFQPILSAVLAGVLLGMALVTAMSLIDLVLRERREKRHHYADGADSKRRYVAPR